jgi:NTE family protein
LCIIMKTIGLALGGGGARGLCHIAFIKALEELGLKASVVSGSSMGAIVGGYYTAGISSREMEDLIEKINFKSISKLVDFSIFRSPAVLKGKHIEEFLDETIPADTFEELKIPFKVVATDFWRKREIVFESGMLIPAIRASMSIPAVFEPMKIENRILIDGGVMNPVPYDLIREECELLIAIDVSGTRTPHSRNMMPTMFESVISTFDLMQESILENKMEIHKPDVYVKPELKNINLLDFHRAEEIMASVKQDVRRFKTEVEEKVQKKKRFGFF